MNQTKKLIGKTANDRGRENEERLLESTLRVGLKFPWFKSARKANEEEDKKGADIVIETSVGKLFLQAKSSRIGAAEFQGKRRQMHVEVVVVTCDQTTTDNRTIGALTRAYKTIEKMRNGKENARETM